MKLEEFLDACEKQLRRVEDVVNRPLILEAELVELDHLLRNEWPAAIIEIKDMAHEPKVREKITMIFKKIKKLENNTKTRISFFDGIEDFMQQTNNR